MSPIRTSTNSHHVAQHICVASQGLDREAARASWGLNKDEAKGAGQSVARNLHAIDGTAWWFCAGLQRRLGLVQATER